MISNCGHDERGKYSGGAAGDQYSNEWQIIKWYNRPWNYVLRHPDAKVRAKIAELARKAAENDKIGYDQGQRLTFWDQLAKCSYDPAKITIYCEADCSSGVAAIVKATGFLLGDKKLQNVNKACYTGNLRAALKKAGFDILTASKYLTSDKYLLVGDILLYEGHHVATNLDNGSKAIDSEPSASKVEPAKKFDKSLAGTYRTTTDLNMRYGAGTTKRKVAVVPKGHSVKCYGYYTSVDNVPWYLVAYSEHTGFMSSKYLSKTYS